MGETGHEWSRLWNRRLRLSASLLEWPDGIARLGVVLVVCTMVSYCLAYLPRALDRLGDQADRNASLAYASK